jgi:drug/metabolite transporter (DMT)-like permease
MQYNSVGMIGIILYMAIPLGYFWDIILFDASMGILEIAGATIIVLTNISIASLRIKGIID